MIDNQLLAELTTKTTQNIEYIQGMLVEISRRERGTPSDKKQSPIEKQLDEARETVGTQIMSNNVLLKQLCAVLVRISDDTFEIAKIVAPILITFSFSKSISVPTEPFAIALVAIAIGRMGVAAICPDSAK